MCFYRSPSTACTSGGTGPVFGFPTEEEYQGLLLHDGPHQGDARYGQITA